MELRASQLKWHINKWHKEPTHWKRSLLGKIEGRRIRGQQKMRWLDDVINSVNKFEQTLGDDEGQGNLACCSPRGCKELDTTERLNNNLSKILRHHTIRTWPNLPDSSVTTLHPAFRSHWSIHYMYSWNLSRMSLQGSLSWEGSIWQPWAYLFKFHFRNFLCGPVAKTPGSQCRGPRCDPWPGN